MTLDLGPGKNFQPHYDGRVIRLDRRVDVKPEIQADVRHLPFRDDCFHNVYASHVLEHLAPQEVPEALREWVRVLRYGGELQLFVPNLDWVALQITHGICDADVLRSVYGRQEYPLDCHKTGFTPATLREALAEFPLRLGPVRTFRNNICIWAMKASV